MEREQALAFRHEFYKEAEEAQIQDDIVSYLGEYRFEVSEFNYRLGIVDGKLTDPNCGELMTDKAKKAIEIRRKEGWSTLREEAEFEGLISIEEQLREKDGTIVWFSPPGPQEEGYGKYGFAYTGRKQGNELKMTAIRLESPGIGDFNQTINALWGETGYQTAEDFLRSPKVVAIDEDRAKEFIHGVFEVKTEQSKNVFQKAMEKMRGVINEYTKVVKNGTEEQKHIAFRVIENFAIEFKSVYEFSEDKNIIFMPGHIRLREAMMMPRYVTQPKPVGGSCGISGRIESNDIFRSISGSRADSFYNNSRSQEWFNCPKCTYKADGPIGNKCPGCGLTKEEYAQNGGLACE